MWNILFERTMRMRLRLMREIRVDYTAKDGVREICNSFSIACYRNELVLSIRIDNMNIVIHRLCSSHWFVCLLCLVMKDGGDEKVDSRSGSVGIFVIIKSAKK